MEALAPLAAFATRWGLSPDSTRLQTALTHTSAALTPAQSSERLEFLGDALLSAWVARVLYDQLPPDTSEDLLTRARMQIVRRETLAIAGRAIGLPDLLHVGFGERKEQRHTHDSLVADAFEAVVAAIFLDLGADALAYFLQETLAVPLQAVLSVPPAPDAKTLLQVRLQKLGRGLPGYVTLSTQSAGNDHVFVVQVRDSQEQILGAGEGANKRAAQMVAADDALRHLSPAPPGTLPTETT